MEKLGDITGGDNKIDLVDLFPNIDWDTTEKAAIKNEQAIDWIKNVLLTADKDSDLGKFIDSAILNK